MNQEDSTRNQANRGQLAQAYELKPDEKAGRGVK